MFECQGHTATPTPHTVTGIWGNGQMVDLMASGYSIRIKTLPVGQLKISPILSLITEFFLASCDMLD
jgi:hypothetical protein